MNSQQKDEKLQHVDGLRGIACFMVVLSHLALIFYPGLHDPDLINNNSIVKLIFNSPLAFAYSGTSAVYIFFVLSGYILTYAFNKGDALSNAAKMTTKRYFRLAVPAIASCVFCWFILSANTPSRELLSAWFNSYRVDSGSFLDSIYSGAVSSFVGDGSKYNPVLWTMKIELIGSFITYFLCLALLKSNKKTLVLIFFSILIFLSSLPQKEKYGYIAFIVGIWVNISNVSTSSIVAAILIAVGVYFGGVHYGSSAYQQSIYYARFFINGEESNAYILFNFLSGSLITAAILTNTFFKRIFGNAFFAYLGKVSFSVYLFHLPVLVISASYVFNTLSNIGASYFLSAIASSSVSIIIIYTISNIIYKFVDRPSMLLSNKVAKMVYDDHPITLK